jgi:hypothetical protein
VILVLSWKYLWASVTALTLAHKSFGVIMPSRRRAATYNCHRCHMNFDVNIDLDSQSIISVDRFPLVCNGDPMKCIHNARDKALLNPWEDGKYRQGY